MDTASEREFREFVVARSNALMRVAAGHIAVAAYFTTGMRSSGNGPKTNGRTWYLYAPASGTYQKTSWAHLDVAPGMRQAAVLEGPLSNGSFRTLAADYNNVNSRQDLGWSRSGTLIWAPTDTVPTRVFYDLKGQPRPAPAHEAEYNDHEAGLSPNGTLLPTFGPAPGPAVTVTNVATGKTVAVLPIEQARAWADDNQLLAIGCDPKKCTGKEEFRNRLVLAGLDGTITPLTGYGRSDGPGAWEPLFTHR